ncbi:hypothetical protein Btru_062813 [Bulinus truncatus]|nr:hypothetical protein Btru_062813 [Bulinus truncatus]
MSGVLSQDATAKIQQNWTYLLTEIDASDIVNSLFENCDITLDQMDEIQSKATRRSRTEAMLKLILSKKKQKMFDTFIAALQEDYMHVIEKLNSTKVLQASEEPLPYSWFKEVPDAKKQLVLKHSDASRFSNCFGNGWETIMYSLGMKRTELELELQNVGHIKKMAITNLIIRWTQRNGRNATLQKFMDAVISGCTGDIVTIDWEDMKKVVDRMTS